jgi:hypothetical protein
MAYLSGRRGKGKHPVLASRDLILLRSDAQHPRAALQYKAQHFATKFSRAPGFGSAEVKDYSDISTQ